MTSPGAAIAEHWQLLATLAMVVAGIYGAIRLMRKDLDDKIHDALLLSLSNGVGDRIRDIVRLAVTESLERHQVQCPVRDRVESMEDRMNRL